MKAITSTLDTRAEQTPHQLAYIFLKDGKNQELSIDYKTLQQESKAIAHTLLSLCSQGDRALLLYPQGLEFITAFLGCLYAFLELIKEDNLESSLDSQLVNFICEYAIASII
ncbi:MAG: AMP-binding protein [Cuspidothrix sp.]